MSAAIFMVLMALVAPAHAGDLFSPVAGDLSIKDFLHPVFGELFGGSGGGLISGAIGVFNTAVLIFGGVLAAYTLIAGTMQTAHDGEMLGKRWSSMWLPIRVTLGTAAVVPVGSYCVAQMFAAWMVIQGIGMADQVWQAFTSQSLGQQAISQPMHSPKVAQLAFGMLRSQVCMKGWTWVATHGDAGIILPGGGAPSGDFASKRRYGVAGFPADQCGNVVGPAGGGGVMATGLSWFGISTGAEDKAKAVRDAHIQASQALESRMAVIADAIVNSNQGNQAGAYAAAIAEYEKTVADVARGQLGSNEYFEQMSRNASQDGWITAGSWFMRFVSIQDSIMKALANSPISSAPAKAPDTVQQSLTGFYEGMNGAIGGSNPSTGLDNQLIADKEREDSESGILGAALDAICSAALKSFNWATEADTGRHPVMVANSAGHMMVNVSLALLVSAAVLGKVSVVIGMAAVGLATAMLAAGMTLAYVLPMIPFIIWVGSLAGWLLSVCEGMLGASLWACQHLNPRGDELIGSAGAGYMLILELAFRPVLMTFGFIFALATSYPLGQFVAKVYFSTFQIGQEGGFVGFIGAIAAAGLYSVLMLTLMRYCFAMIHKIPDELMRWIGGGKSSGLAEASGAAMQSEGRGGAAGAAVGGAAGAMVSQRLRNINSEQQRGKEGDKEGKRQPADPKGGAASSAPMDEKGAAPQLMAVFIQKDKADQVQDEEGEKHDAMGAAHSLGRAVGESMDDSKQAGELEKLGPESDKRD